MPLPRPRSAAPRVGGRGETLERLTPEAFAARLQACTSVLWTSAAGILGDRVGAEDVVQEAALIGLQKLDRFTPGTSFVAWMGRIVRNVALNHARLRTRRRTHPTEGQVLDQQPGRDGGSAASDGGRLEGAVDDPAAWAGSHALFDGELAAALGELKPVARACLLLKTVLELDYSEIGAVLDVPEGTAMSHVHRARRQLRGRLGASRRAAPVEPRP